MKTLKEIWIHCSIEITFGNAYNENMKISNMINVDENG